MAKGDATQNEELLVFYTLNVIVLEDGDLVLAMTFFFR
jgi:hypothetical protein